MATMARFSLSLTLLINKVQDDFSSLNLSRPCQFSPFQPCKYSPSNLQTKRKLRLDNIVYLSRLSIPDTNTITALGKGFAVIIFGYQDFFDCKIMSVNGMNWLMNAVKVPDF